MKWNFPITKTIGCHKCRKNFEIILRSKNSKRHPCPDCGEIHVFDFAAIEKAALKQANEALRKAFRK